MQGIRNAHSSLSGSLYSLNDHSRSSQSCHFIAGELAQRDNVTCHSWDLNLGLVSTRLVSQPPAIVQVHIGSTSAVYFVGDHGQGASPHLRLKYSPPFKTGVISHTHAQGGCEFKYLGDVC